MKWGLVLGLLFFLPAGAGAHPLDEFGTVNVYDQKQTITLAPNKTSLTIDLTFYPMEKIKVWESIDTNRDQILTQEERDIWMKKGQEASWLEISGQRIGFEAVKLQFADYYDFFGSKPAKVSITFETRQRVGPGKVGYFYQGKDKRLEEIELEVKGENGLRIDDLRKALPDEVEFLVSGGEGVGVVLGMTTNNRLNAFLNKYVKVDVISSRLVVFAMAVAFLLGALHALTPGHGKAIVASYLVGEKGTIWHAINLGLIVTLTHTASVFVLGLASVLLTAVFVPATVIKTLNMVSGVAVLLFGLYLVVKRSLLIFRKDHVHEHHHEEMVISWKNLIPLGVSGGIVPCVDALAILIVAISLGKIVFGLMLLVAFSLGLATALVGIGVLAVVAKDRMQERIKNITGAEKYISVVSAAVVMLLGIGILFNFGI